MGLQGVGHDERPTQYLEKSKRPCLDREEVRQTFYFCSSLFWGIYIAFQIKATPLKNIPNLAFWAKGNKRNQHLFKLYWRRLLRAPQTARRSNQSVLKEINPECSLEGLLLKLKLQYFGHLIQRTDPDAGKDWRLEEKRMTEDEMVGWHHQLDGHEFEQALGVGEGQGSLACSPWDHWELDTTEWLNSNIPV